MFLLFEGTSDVEQTDIELSLESVQCHLGSPSCMWLMFWGLLSGCRASYSHLCASVTKQYNLVPAKAEE